MNEATREQLLSAVLKGRPWLRRFTMAEYAAAFQSYLAEFGPAYLEAARSAPDLSALAAELLEGMEADWKRQRPWNRTAARMDCLQMLVDYLSPMLLELDEPACGQLAERLREAWSRRRPKEAYQIASYQKVKGGFRRTFMGIPLGDRPSETDS